LTPRFVNARLDPAFLALTVVFSDAPVEESDEVKPGVILDYDLAGNVVGMEILDTSISHKDVGCGDEGTASLAIDAVRKLTTSYRAAPVPVRPACIWYAFGMKAVISFRLALPSNPGGDVGEKLPESRLPRSATYIAKYRKTGSSRNVGHLPVQPETTTATWR
jgi:uncharacterized protein YuzE